MVVHAKMMTQTGKCQGSIPEEIGGPLIGGMASSPGFTGWLEIGCLYPLHDGLLSSWIVSGETDAQSWSTPRASGLLFRMIGEELGQSRLDMACGQGRLSSR